MKKALVKLMTAGMLACILVSPASAASPAGDSAGIPYTSYNYYYGDVTKPAEINAFYDVETVLTAARAGVEPFQEINDICTDSGGNLYILDGKGSRVVLLDGDYRLRGEFSGVKDGDEILSFSGARGIYVSGESLYIADTEHARVLVCDTSGTLMRTILLPDSPLIPEGFLYRPIKVAVDASGYVYVLSDGSYYGAILYSPEQEFLSFYGANSVKNTITQALAKLWKKLTATNDRLANSASRLPYQFTDLYVDTDSFIYTATGKTPDSVQAGQIRRLSPGGKNVLESEDITFGDLSISMAGGEMRTQNIAGLAVDTAGFIYCYDISYGRIYLYDADCMLLAAFGGGIGNGQQDGTFAQIGGIDILDDGDRIVVADSLHTSVTVFRVTDFGKKVKSARSLTLSGAYHEAVPLWEEVLQADAGCQMAYLGLSKAALAQKNYAAALEYAEKGNSASVYSEAFSYQRRDFIDSHLNGIMGILLAVTAAVVAVVIVIKKKKLVLVKNQAVRQMFAAPFHPALVFGEVKEKRKGSVALGAAVMAAFYVSLILKTTASGFLFRTDAGSFNSVLVLLQTVGFVLLWTVVSWAVATLLGGIGKLREIFVVVTYSLLPMVFGNIVSTILSYGLTEEEGVFLTVFGAFMLLVSVFMLIIGSMIVHDISFGKFLGITLLTLAGALIVLFLLVLIIILVQQTAGFGGTLIRELFFR